MHTTLLRAGIPIVEHMTNLGALPLDGFRFTAVPPKISGDGHLPGAGARAARTLSGAPSALIEGRACCTLRDD